jgi:hypothetical protein
LRIRLNAQNYYKKHILQERLRHIRQNTKLQSLT